MNPQSLGQLMISVEGLSLDALSKERLLHPDVGGVILFSRNHAEIDQLRQLVYEIKSLRNEPLLVSVDQEGGLVQRFKKGFTLLPPMAAIGEIYEVDPERACQHAEDVGVVLAAELGALGIDFSFTPVVDLLSDNRAIANRAFHADPAVVRILSSALGKGLSDNGMQAVAKHFPGHSGVIEDPHFDLPTDQRSLLELQSADIRVYESLEDAGIKAVMTCHVVFPAVDSLPASFSSRWIKEELRGRLGYGGLVVSDDVMMGALSQYGEPIDRVRKARDAGCDLILLCNDDAAADSVLAGGGLPALSAASLKRLQAMRQVTRPASNETAEAARARLGAIS